jgi:hypothetical protein
MTEIEKLAFKYRAKLIIDNLKNCTSGAEVHEVGNMQQTAQGILDVVNDDKDAREIEGIIGRLEQKQLEFFKKKFEYLNTTQTQTVMTTRDAAHNIVQTQTQEVKPNKSSRDDTTV